MSPLFNKLKGPAGGTALSRLLGAGRDIVISRFLGANGSSDAFWVAFTIPTIFRRFVADEGLTGAMIPALTAAEKEEGIQAAQRLTRKIAAALILANTVLIAMGLAFTPQLVRLFANDFAADPEKFALTVDMTRWLLPFLVMVSFVSLFEGLLNFRGHFFIPKLAPGLVSVGFMLSAFVLGTSFTEPAWALVIGCLVGGVAHVLINLPKLWQLWGPVGFSFSFRNDPRFQRVLREMGKVVGIGIFAQFNVIVLRSLGAMVGDGAITHYWYANRIVDLAQGVISVSIASVALPPLAAAAANQDWTKLQETLDDALQTTAFLLIPAAAVVASLTLPITAVLFGGGKFSATDVLTTSQTALAMVPFMLAVGGINIIKKPFMAIDDRWPLLIVGGIGVLLTLVLGLTFIEDYGVVGLGYALSISTVIQFVLYFPVLQVRINKHAAQTVRLYALKSLSQLTRMTIAAVPMALFLHQVAQLDRWQEGFLFSSLGVLCLALSVAGLIYAVCAWILHVDHARRLASSLKQRLG